MGQDNHNTEAQISPELITWRDIAKRTNVSLTQPNYDYLETMSRAAGVNHTQFLNQIIQQHMESHADLYKQAQEFRQVARGSYGR